MLALRGSIAMALPGGQVRLICCLGTHRIDPCITDSKECHLALLSAEREYWEAEQMSGAKYILQYKV